LDKELVKVLDSLNKGIAKLNKNERGILVDNGLGIKLNELEIKRSKEDIASYATDIAKKMGVTEENAINITGMEYSDFIKTLISNYNNAELAKVKADKKAEKYGIEKELQNSLRLFSNTTATEYQKLTNIFSELMVSGGNISEFKNLIPEMLGNLAGETRETVETLILNTTWMDRNSIDSTIEAFKNLGVAIEDNLIREIYEATNAAADFSLDKLNQELSSLDSLAKMVEEKMKESNRSYTQEEKDELIKKGFGEGEFVRVDIDEYVFMGETNELLGEINDKMSIIMD
jgi:hypothetical protein